MERIVFTLRRCVAYTWGLASAAFLCAIVTFLFTAAVFPDTKKLEKGDLIYAQGMASRVPGNHWGHVAIYIGDYRVTRKGGYTLRDEVFDEAPLRVFRNGQPIMLRRGQRIEEGDLIPDAVVEMRKTGAVINSVDGVSRIASIYGYHLNKKMIDWKTTLPPPTTDQRERICSLALSKVDLTEEGGLEYDLGEKASRDWFSRKEEFDCVSLAEWCYEQVGLNPTPDSYEGNLDYLRPQEQYDNIDRKESPSAEPVIFGKWFWFNKAEVTISQGGKMTATLNGRYFNHGKWWVKDRAKREYVLKWEVGGWEDTLILSADGMTLSGQNKQKVRVTADRILR